jgi:hypothetical protein
MANRIPISSTLSVTQGETFVTKKFFPIDEDSVAFDLTGATAHMQARATASSATAAIDLDESTGIDLDDTDNSFRYDVDEADTALWTAGTYVFDLFIQLASGRRILAQQGTIKVNDAVTVYP